MLVVAPPLIDESKYDQASRRIFGTGAHDRSLELPVTYQGVADELNASFLNLQTVCLPAIGDGIHLDLKGNQAVASALEHRIKELLL